jgi:hypothetical protein
MEGPHCNGGAIYRATLMCTSCTNPQYECPVLRHTSHFWLYWQVQMYGSRCQLHHSKQSIHAALHHRCHKSQIKPLVPHTGRSQHVAAVGSEVVFRIQGSTLKTLKHWVLTHTGHHMRMHMYSRAPVSRTITQSEREAVPWQREVHGGVAPPCFRLPLDASAHEVGIHSRHGDAHALALELAAMVAGVAIPAPQQAAEINRMCAGLTSLYTLWHGKWPWQYVQRRPQHLVAEHLASAWQPQCCCYLPSQPLSCDCCAPHIKAWRLAPPTHSVLAGLLEV